MMSALKVVVIIVCIAVCIAELPDYIERCSLSDPNLNECALRSTKKALPRMVKGDRKYKLARVEPIRVPEMTIRVGNTLKMQMRQVQISGIGDSDVRKVNFDFDKNQISTAFFVPNLNILSRYLISGSALNVPIEGQGTVNITMSRVNFTYDFDFDLVKRNGEEFIQPLKPIVTFKSDGGYVDFGDLFSGDSTLGVQVNEFLNDNWEDAENELRGDIAPAIAAIMTSLAQQYFNKFSMADMFLP